MSAPLYGASLHKVSAASPLVGDDYRFFHRRVAKNQVSFVRAVANSLSNSACSYSFPKAVYPPLGPLPIAQMRFFHNQVTNK